MIRFTDLIHTTVVVKQPGTPGAAALPMLLQDESERRFPTVVAASRLHLWEPGDPIVTSGRRVLVGVWTASAYDMRLLDILDEAVASGFTDGDRLEVFNCQRFDSWEDFKPYIPALEPAVHTPHIGLWQDGLMQWCQSGPSARDRLLELYGFRFTSD